MVAGRRKPAASQGLLHLLHGRSESSQNKSWRRPGTRVRQSPLSSYNSDPVGCSWVHFIVTFHMCPSNKLSPDFEQCLYRKTDNKYTRQGDNGPKPYNKYTRQGAQE